MREIRNRVSSILFCIMLCLGASYGYAGGVSPMALEQVAPQAEVIALAEVMTHTGKEVFRKADSSGKFGSASVRHSYDIKVKVLDLIKGSVPDKELELKYELVVVEGVWVSFPGTGIELRMKSGEEYVIFLERRGDQWQLLRAEEATRLPMIRDEIKKGVDEVQANGPASPIPSPSR